LCQLETQVRLVANLRLPDFQKIRAARVGAGSELFDSQWSGIAPDRAGHVEAWREIGSAE
jgi:hypothetical protein